MSNKTEHLKIIQGVVNRLADNSNKIKGWAVTISSALLALSTATDYHLDIIAINYLPLVMFWILDGYFLWQERLFRSVYIDVTMKKEEDIDFSMNPTNFIGGRNTWLDSMFSKTLNTFYGVLILSMLGIYWYLKN